MTNYVFFELLLFALYFVSPDYNKISVEMIAEGKEVAVWHFDGKFITVDIDGKRERMEVRFIDNALYELRRRGEEPITVDVAPYFIQVESWAKRMKRAQTINDTAEEPLYLQPGEDNFYINSPSNGITFVISRKYLE